MMDIGLLWSIINLSAKITLYYTCCYIKYYSLFTGTLCEAKSEGLVRYPTVFGGTVAHLQCADNAHSNSSNMRVFCDSNGIWSNHNISECHCNDGYRILNITGERLLCQGVT